MRTCSSDSLTASSTNKISVCSANSVNKNVSKLPPFKQTPIVEADVSLVWLCIVMRVLVTCIADPQILSSWTETDLRTDSLHQSDAPLGLTWCS